LLKISERESALILSLCQVIELVGLYVPEQNHAKLNKNEQTELNLDDMVP
jgi:ribosomal protein S16